MKKSELETMRKSFNTVKSRSSSIKNSPQVLKLEKRVKNMKESAIENNDELIEMAKNSFKRNGIEFFDAKTDLEAQNIILNIIKDVDSRVIAKSKSNTLGEIEAKVFLKENGYEVVETDLGDRILQLKKVDNKPVHPTGPASHLNINEITEIVNEALNESLSPVAREIMETVRGDVLENLKESKIGISGANAVASEEGSLVFVHKFVESLEDAISIAKLETVYATGNYVTSYINIISGPSKTADIEKKLLKNMYGAERVVVIILDNGRSEANQECLKCIGCGNCIVHCPVYNAVGNEFGFNNYLGGRGVAMSKFIQDDEVCFDSGLYMCTLCGLCTLNCPVSIETNSIIEILRNDSKSKGFYPKAHGIISKNISDNDSPF